MPPPEIRDAAMAKRQTLLAAPDGTFAATLLARDAAVDTPITELA